MKNLRLMLFFLFGLLLGGWSVWASAETITAPPATGYEVWTGTGTKFSGATPAAACIAAAPTMAYPTAGAGDLNTASGTWCKFGKAGVCSDCYQFHYTNATGVACPSGQNWTLSGSNCTRPDCVAPETRNATTGLCETINPCVSGASGTTTYYRGDFSVSTIAGNTIGNVNPAPSTLCDGACSGTVNETQTSCHSTEAASINDPKPIICEANITKTGAQCSGGNGSAPDLPATTCTSKGMCSGTVGSTTVCVPCQTTNTQTTNTTTTPAGGTPTTTTNTTTTTCSGDGACTTTTNTSNSTQTTTTTTSAPVSGNGKGTATATGNGDYKLDLPTDYQRDATGMETNKTLGEIKEKMTPDTSDSSPVTGATHDPAVQTELEAKNQQFTDAATGATDPTSSTRGVWSTAMSSGWFEPITIAGCAPVDTQVGGKTWHFDPCDTAAKISEIGAYCMYILTAFGLFAMFTGGKVES